MSAFPPYNRQDQPHQQQQQQQRSRWAIRVFGYEMEISITDAAIASFFGVWILLIGVVHFHLYNTVASSNVPTPDKIISVHALQGLTASLAQQQKSRRSTSPLTIHEITGYLSQWISQLHQELQASTYRTQKETAIWSAFHNLTIHTLYPWDKEYLQRMPLRRQDGSIFLSVASYRDANCLPTLLEAYNKAKDPHKLFVGLVQQNCNRDCFTGIMEDGKSRPQPNPDPDCHAEFCASVQGKPFCEAGQIRALHIEEPESLGPYMARFFASKLWDGEEWYMQVDSHMTFAQDWDAISIQGLKKAPSPKPIISHYPPGHDEDLKQFETRPSSRICGPIFTSETIRLEGSGNYDKKKIDIPRFSPVTGAGYFVGHSSFLQEVPFDPFLPWIFMGEEIIISSRLWTSGYDMFSPAQAVVGHIYFRHHQPKFWESVHRAFTMGVHNPLEELVVDRIKYQMGFPEASRDMIPKSVLTAVDEYSMGKERTLDDYMRMIGMNATTKEVTTMTWCEKGQPPPGFEQFAHLYADGK